MKRFISLILCTVMLMSMSTLSFAVSAADTAQYPDSYIKDNMLYAHAVSDEAETQSWHHWQHRDAYIDYDDEDHEELGLVKGEGISEEKYFFLPSSVKDNKVILLNTYESEVTINGTSIPAGETKEFAFETDREYTVTVSGEIHKLFFKVSTAEASIFINNPDADGNGTDLFSYLFPIT